MSECLVWTGEGGQQLKAPVSAKLLKSHCALLVSHAFGGQPGGHKYAISTNWHFLCVELQWHSLSPVITVMPAGDKSGILWRHIVQKDLENKAVSEHLAIVSLETLQGSLLYCSALSTQSQCHMPGIPWASFCRPRKEKIHFLNHLLPFALTVCFHIRQQPVVTPVFGKCIFWGKTWELYQHESDLHCLLWGGVVSDGGGGGGGRHAALSAQISRLHGPQVSSTCKQISLTLPPRGQNVSWIFLALLTGKVR